jgi:hypothetical protein
MDIEQILYQIAQFALFTLGIMTGAAIVTFVYACYLSVTDKDGVTQKLIDHEETTDWLRKEYGRFSPEAAAGLALVAGGEHVRAEHVQTLRPLVEIAPRRVANDLRMLIHEYEQEAEAAND